MEGYEDTLFELQKVRIHQAESHLHACQEERLGQMNGQNIQKERMIYNVF